MNYENVFAESFKDAFQINKRILNSDYKLHLHDFFKFEYILSGSGVTEINNVQYDLSAGSLIFVTPYDFQKVIVNEPIELININFTEFYIQQDLIDYCENASVINGISADFFELLLDEFNEKNWNHEIVIKNILNLLIVKSVRNEINQENNKSLNIAYRMLFYIKRHYSEDITLKSLSEKFGYSSNYLNSLFKKQFGVTLKEYAINIKLEMAKKMLMFTNLSIEDVCYKSGFSYLPNFHRAFKLKYGMTPKQFKNEKQ